MMRMRGHNYQVLRDDTVIGRVRKLGFPVEDSGVHWLEEFWQAWPLGDPEPDINTCKVFRCRREAAVHLLEESVK